MRVSGCLWLLAWLSLFTGGCSRTEVPEFSQAEWQPGGKMTHKRLSKRSYVFAGQAASKQQQLDFWTGFSLFRDPWVIAPSSTKDRDGLGPLFNARSCIACHSDGSRGKMSQSGESLPTSLVLRVGSTTIANYANNHAYGGQIQPRAIRFNQGEAQHKPQGEAWLQLDESVERSSFADGENYQLTRPHYQLTKMAFGPLPEQVTVSPRLSPNIYGVGLLDAISEQDLLQQEDIADSDKDGISAKYNRVLDVITGELLIGRFGLKAKQPSLKQQIAAAFRDDIGITNNLFTEESCTQQQVNCQRAAKIGGHSSVEIPDKLLNLVVSFNRLLGVPPARDLEQKEVQHGRALFYQSGCHLCHTPSYDIAEDYPDAAIAGQKIWPYTDLALHDMGTDLADGMLEFDAFGQEWRTPPLWGIGLQADIVGEQRLLHDGRARSVSEAILWHGGEAEQSRQYFIQLNQAERQALVRFVNSI
ncbi:thiol oxidoreductase [Thalassotalea insulae]|uniref:Thiol oxidoreductase n=1 Tax=Thalassotalea insulae TaxID=2056778 RepID=A0ABQ6GSC4_9GAMM|nr:di-heme oxidoredictase family protein [Thalassotalea insulae]GLX78855.1 thiol oxidoreductase [Thalassotalea insulae]